MKTPSRKPTPQEKRFLIRAYLAREEVQIKRTKFFNRVFWLAIISAALAVLLYAITGNFWITLLLRAVNFICLLIYTDFIGVPRSYTQDMDLRWHMNPWQDSLSRMNDEGRQYKTFILIGVVVVMRFAFLALK